MQMAATPCACYEENLEGFIDDSCAETAVTVMRCSGCDRGGSEVQFIDRLVFLVGAFGGNFYLGISIQVFPISFANRFQAILQIWIQFVFSVQQLVQIFRDFVTSRHACHVTSRLVSVQCHQYWYMFDQWYATILVTCRKQFDHNFVLASLGLFKTPPPIFLTNDASAQRAASNFSGLH